MIGRRGREGKGEEEAGEVGDGKDVEEREEIRF